MDQERPRLSKEELDKMEAEQMPSDEAIEAEDQEFGKFNENQTEKFADATNIEAILNGFESSKSKQTQKEFIEGFNSVRNQLKPFFEKYGVSEPACFKDIGVGDNLQEVYYDVKLAGYGLLREKMSR